jgi:prepilin-type N-terminal cleavage/methylation domain-containing protein
VTIRTGLTLIELMAVVTLLAVAVGVATLNMHGISEEARLLAAAEQIASCCRLAAIEADRTGRPHVMVLNEGRCAMKRPRLVDGSWRWEMAGEFELGSKVRILPGQSPELATDSTSGRWQFPVPPGDPGSLMVRLRLESGAAAAADIRCSLGTVQLRPERNP